jgi:hypothetical protein
MIMERSDDRTGLCFTIAVGPRQRSHSRVRVPHFTVSYSRHPFSSPPTTPRATVEVFDPASTRDAPELTAYSWLWQLGGRGRRHSLEGFYSALLDGVVLETIVITMVTMSIAVYMFTAYPRNVCGQSLPSNGWLYRLNNVSPAVGWQWMFAWTSIFRILGNTSQYVQQRGETWCPDTPGSE